MINCWFIMLIFLLFCIIDFIYFFLDFPFHIILLLIFSLDIFCRHQYHYVLSVFMYQSQTSGAYAIFCIFSFLYSTFGNLKINIKHYYQMKLPKIFQIIKKQNIFFLDNKPLKYQLNVSIRNRSSSLNSIQIFLCLWTGFNQ